MIINGQIAGSGGTVPDASLTTKGIVQLTNDFDGTSETLATTEKALKDGLASISNSAILPIEINTNAISIRDASVTQKGATQLTNDATDKTSVDVATTPKQVADAIINAAYTGFDAIDINATTREISAKDATTTQKGVTTLQIDTIDVTSTINAATPKYVNDLIQKSQLNPNVLAQVFGASTLDIPLTGSVTYNQLVIPNGERWLAAGQTDPITNGIYIVNTSGAWTRATDADTAAELYIAQVTALNGDAGQYLCTIASTAVVGTDPISWIQLYKADNQFVGVQLYNSATVYSADTLVVNPAVNQYIYRCLIDGTNNIVPSMASPNWEIYQGLLYANSAIVAPNGDDTKSEGFPYATFNAAINDARDNKYIEGRAITDGLQSVGIAKNNITVTGNECIVNDITVNGSAIKVTGFYSRNILTPAFPDINIINSSSCVIEDLRIGGGVTGRTLGAIQLQNTNGSIYIRNLVVDSASEFFITGTNASDIYFEHCSQIVTLNVNAALTNVYLHDCPNFILNVTAGNVTNGKFVDLTTNQTIGGDKTFTGNFAQTGAGTFATGSGLNTLGGDVLVNGISITSAGLLSLQSGANTALTVDSGGNGNLEFGTSTLAKNITIGNVTGTTSITERTGTGGYTLTTTNGIITQNSGSGVQSYSTDTAATAINIGTGAANKTIVMGSTTGASGTTIHGGSNGVTIAPTGAQPVAIGNTTGASSTTISSGTAGNSFISNTTTTNANTMTSSSVTSGNVLSVSANSTARLTNSTVLGVSSSGANAAAGITTVAATLSTTNTGATNTNIGLQVASSGGSTANYGILSTSAAALNGFGTSTPTTTLDSAGSFGMNTVTTAAAAYTVLNTDSTVVLSLAGTQTITLPAVGTSTRRVLTFVNPTTNATKVFASNYTNLQGVAGTAIPSNSTITLQCDGSVWRQIDGSVRLPNVQTFTASGTYTPTAGMKYCIVEAVGGGGAGGGVSANQGAQTGTFGAGANSGAYVKVLLTAAQIGASQAVTIGAGGVGTAATGVGAAGSATTLGALFSAVGGAGGTQNTTNSNYLNGLFSIAVPAAASNPTITTGINLGSSPSGLGTVGMSGGGSGFIGTTTGTGGSSAFGVGGRGPYTNAGSGSNAAIAGVSAVANSGGGGSGAWGYGATSIAQTGGSGGSGRMIITEFFA